MKRLDYPMSQEWHVSINQYNSGKMGTPDLKRWMYEAKKMADEVPRMVQVLGMERRGELAKTHKQCSMTPEVPIQGNHLRCCLGVKCAECPELLSLDNMKRVTQDDIDAAVTKIARAARRIDNYLFVTTDVIDPVVAEYSATFYEKTDGTEIAILDCVGFLRHFLHLFHRVRGDYLTAYQTLLLTEPDSAVSQSLKEAFLALRQAAESGE